MLWIGTAAGELRAELIPVWSTPNPATVSVPIGRSVLFRAEGLMTGAFDAMLIFDNSNSMAFDIPADAPAARNGGRERGDWAWDGADDLIDGLADEVRLGIVAFAGNAVLLRPVTELGAADATPSERAAQKAALRTLRRNGSGTNIGNAITFATQRLLTAPNATNSRHLVIVTDGEPTAGNAITATRNAIAAGIDTVNTIALPGADVAHLEQIANEGHGTFADGTNLEALLEEFRSILEGSETLVNLEIQIPNGTWIDNVPVNAEGEFYIDARVNEGDNLFRVRATSNLGNVVVRDLHVIGETVPIPEPAALSLAAAACGAFAFRRSVRARRGAGGRS
jgi:Ca-activated chloride channel family protein